MPQPDDTLQRFERLAAEARCETPPRVDVTAAVRARLRAAASTASVALLPRWAYGLTGALSAAAAACAWLGWHSMTVLSDPMSGWLLASAVR